MTAARAGIALVLIGTIVGCDADPGPVPGGPVAFDRFRVVAPAGWSIESVSGLPGPVLAGPARDGLRANLLVERTLPGPLDTAESRYRAGLATTGARTWRDAAESPWEPPTGMPGRRVISERTNPAGIAIVHHHYLLGIGEEVLVLTATCAKSAEAELAPVFDRIVATLEIGR